MLVFHYPCTRFISITYGASSSGQERTIAFLNYFAQKYPFFISRIALHITCTEKTRLELLQTITHFYNFGIRQFVIIRGDGNIVKDGFKYASELVEFVRSRFLDVAIYIAGYPEKQDELEFTNNKIQYGVNACITQICFDTQKVINFKQQLKLPVLPGIILPTDKTASFVKKIGVEFANVHDPTEFVKKQVVDFVNAGFKHLHFYTLNNISNLLFLFYDSI